MLGQPYRWGGAAPGGFDCSGLVVYAAAGTGLHVPRTAEEQLHAGASVSRRDVRTGDLVFMHLKRKELHVGIAIDNDKFIHAPATRRPCAHRFAETRRPMPAATSRRAASWARGRRALLLRYNEHTNSPIRPHGPTLAENLMKLYYSPGACSLSPHIVLLEAGLDFTAEKVDLKSKKTESGADFTTVNSKGAVPALVMDDGKVLTEGAAIVQYLADRKAAIRPGAGQWHARALPPHRAAELHRLGNPQGLFPLFNPAITPEAKAAAIANLDKKFTFLTAQLGDKPYMLGDTFTVADAYYSRS